VNVVRKSHHLIVRKQDTHWYQHLILSLSKRFKVYGTKRLTTFDT